MQKNKIDFETLERATQTQNDIANWLLLECAKLTATTAKEERKEWGKDFEQLKKTIMPNFDETGKTLKGVVKEWWIEELKWYAENESNFSKNDLDNFLTYRLQRIFFKNHSSNPFKRTKRNILMRKRIVLSEEFSQVNQNLFGDFLKKSFDIIYQEKEFERIKSVVGHIKILQKVDISESVASAIHDLFGKDWKMLKGFVVGGGIGVVTSIFLGPVIGAAIGEMAGLSGAAATSYGLAFLGGGSIASGGLGMAGGSFFLGLGFGIANGVRGVDNVSQDELDHAQAGAVLPLLLSIGRIQYQELGDRQIPDLIHATVSNRLREFDTRLDQLEKSNKIADRRKSKVVGETKELYQNAVDMSELYDWCSFRDIWKELAS